MVAFSNVTYWWISQRNCENMVLLTGYFLRNKHPMSQFSIVSFFQNLYMIDYHTVFSVLRIMVISYNANSMNFNAEFLNSTRFCFLNCSVRKKMLYWSRKTFQIQGWRPRICKKFEIARTIYSNSEKKEQFCKNAFKSYSREQIEFILEKNDWDLFGI